MTHTIENLGKRDWALYVKDGNLVAGKMIPYDGVLIYTTEQRSYVSYRKNSQYNLSPSEVVNKYVQKSDTESMKDQLYADAMEALEEVAEA